MFLNTKNERIISFLQKMLPISKDPTISLFAEDYKHLGGDYRVTTNQNAFVEGRALFWLDAMYQVNKLRSMDLDFGILPVPKYDEAQETYSSFMHISNGTTIAVPSNVADIDLSGRILEDLMYESSQGVVDAYVETTLKGKAARDQESADMIGYIIDNVRTDYALLLNSYGLKIDSDMRGLMNKGSADVASTFAKKEAEYNQVLEKFIASFPNK